MNPPTKTADIPTKAEFMIVLEWDENSAADVDLWIQRDDEEPIGYKNKESTVLHLERDDLGHSTDTVNINGIVTVVPLNREVITIRGVVPGEYYVGVHYYRAPSSTAYEQHVSKVPSVAKIVKGTVTFMDVNPYVEVWSHSFEMSEDGTKINLPAVTINEEGRVTAIYAHNRQLGPNLKPEQQSAWNYN